jgi:rod shape-determining protein MreC
VHDTRRTRVVLACLLTVALALIATDYLGGSAPLRAIGGAAFGTAERAISSVTGPIAGFFERGADAAGAGRRAQALERQLIKLRAQLSSEKLSRTDYTQLVKLLRLSRRAGNRIVAATVIAVGQGYDQAVTLDAGSRDGIRPEETVLNASGLVGTVTSVNPWTCTVLLATSTTAVAGVRLPASGQMGWVTGTAMSLSGSDVLRLHVLGPSSAVAPGQQLVTSASVGDRPYVAGVPVGVVTRVATGAGLTRTALVRPFVDFTALDVVGVVITPNRSGPAAGG